MKTINEFIVKSKGKNLCNDSRKIKPGDVFLAYQGEKNDGHLYIDDAINNGAVAIIGEKNISLSVPYLKIVNARLIWAEIQANLAGNPEKFMHFVGVTGTDGKTTTVNLIYEILKDYGKNVGVISTIEAKYGDKVIDTGLHTSTPNAEILFPILKEMRNAGVLWVVLETTSHGLAQDRIGGIRFDYGVITNVGSDHLEFHGNIENYILAKAKLLEKSKVSVINQTVLGIEIFKNKASGKILYYDFSKQIKNQEYVSVKTNVIQKFEIKYQKRWIGVKTILLGKYNIENILAASVVAMDLNIPTENFVATIKKFRPPKGRFGKIKNNRGINIIVDFAHTEQGLRAIFEVINEIKNKSEKIIAVFGANGERDRTKRGPMGRVAAKLTDKVIITSEDTNNESVSQIFEDIKKGFDEANTKKKLLRIDDRKNAIKQALKIAEKGDWVLCLGKGHEQSMNIDGKEYPWNEEDVICDLLKII